MLRWQTMVGSVIGLMVGFGILSLTVNKKKPEPPTGAILSECNGRLAELVIHYDPGSKGIVATAYRDFLGALDTNVTVHVVCQDRAAYDDFLPLASAARCQLAPVITRHPITTWSRDRWVALAPVAPGAVTTILSPRGEVAAELWPARAGDQQVGDSLARALQPAARAVRSEFYYDGGDFLADGENVFVMPRVLQRNIQQTTYTRETFLKAITTQLKRRVILLNQAPEHHAGMFMASVGNHTMLVGDPSLGKKFLPEADGTNTFMNLPGGPDFTSATQQLFDAVAAQCAATGYRVVRIPTVPAADGRTYLTYVNALLDEVNGRRIVYLPVYRGAEALNTAASKVWKNLGYEIRPVDCTEVFRNFGCLHCLVNVLKRS